MKNKLHWKINVPRWTFRNGLTWMYCIKLNELLCLVNMKLKGEMLTWAEIKPEYNFCFRSVNPQNNFTTLNLSVNVCVCFTVWVRDWRLCFNIHKCFWKTEKTKMRWTEMFIHRLTPTWVMCHSLLFCWKVHILCVNSLKILLWKL